MPIASTQATIFVNVALIAAAVFIIMAIFAPVKAQFCETPLCREGETYSPGREDPDGAYGSCRSTSGLGYRSHYLARCEDGWTLALDRGVCVRDACAGGGVCGAQVPLCQPTERYSRSGSDSDGDYGVCNSGPAPVTRAMSHRLARCGEGWTLLADAGLCRRDCAARLEIDPDIVGPIPFPDIPGVDPDRFRLRPDLVLTRVWLKSSTGAQIKSVSAGSAYYLCYEARNQGNFASGVFKVRSGGLAIPTPPEQNQVSLAPGASREGCLFYPVTPRAGRYTVQATADPDNVIAEMREDNNSRNLTFQVR